MVTKKIDPRVYMPPVEGYEYQEDALASEVEATTSDETLYLDGAGAIGLQPPENITIVEQIVRKASDGRSLVDLVIEVEDMPGATEYEVRTASV